MKIARTRKIFFHLNYLVQDPGALWQGFTIFFYLEINNVIFRVFFMSHHIFDQLGVSRPYPLSF
jgi:hypothetical protein